MKAHVLALVLVFALVLAACSRTPDSGRYTGPIIDMHLHAGATVPQLLDADGKPPPLLCLPHPCEEIAAKATSEEEVLEQTLAMMDRHNIVLAFLSGDPERVRMWVDAGPGRFIPSPFVLQPSESNLEMLRKAYDSGRYEGMGEIAAQLSGFQPGDMELEPYFALAEELDIPALIHTLGIGPPFPTFRVQAGKPVLLEEVLVRHPKLRLFVENSGFPFTSEWIAMAHQYPQLYGDVSTITWVVAREGFYDHLEGIVRAGLSKRIMFGSDQMVWPESIELAIEAIQSADFLTAEQKADIFYNNAARFLRLTDEQTARHRALAAPN